MVLNKKNRSSWEWIICPKLTELWFTCDFVKRYRVTVTSLIRVVKWPIKNHHQHLPPYIIHLKYTNFILFFCFTFHRCIRSSKWFISLIQDNWAWECKNQIQNSQRTLFILVFKINCAMVIRVNINDNFVILHRCRQNTDKFSEHRQ